MKEDLAPSRFHQIGRAKCKSFSLIFKATSHASESSILACKERRPAAFMDIGFSLLYQISAVGIFTSSQSVGRVKHTRSLGNKKL